MPAVDNNIDGDSAGGVGGGGGGGGGGGQFVPTGSVWAKYRELRKLLCQPFTSFQADCVATRVSSTGSGRASFPSKEIDYIITSQTATLHDWDTAFEKKI